MFNIFKLWRRLASAEGQLIASRAEIVDLRYRIEGLESERKELMDHLLVMSGASTLYSTTAAAQRQQERQASAPVTTKPHLTSTARTARDYQRLAEQALNNDYMAEGQQ
jgi:hypothetical protein